MFMAKKESKGDISVREVEYEGGTTTKERHGPEFYRQIGHKGGQKVKRAHRARQVFRAVGAFSPYSFSKGL